MVYMTGKQKSVPVKPIWKVVYGTEDTRKYSNTVPVYFWVKLKAKNGNTIFGELFNSKAHAKKLAVRIANQLGCKVEMIK
jgi:hypothetical protein